MKIRKEMMIGGFIAIMSLGVMGLGGCAGNANTVSEGVALKEHVTPVEIVNNTTGNIIINFVGYIPDDNRYSNGNTLFWVSNAFENGMTSSNAVISTIYEEPTADGHGAYIFRVSFFDRNEWKSFAWWGKIGYTERELGRTFYKELVFSELREGTYSTYDDWLNNTGTGYPSLELDQ